MWLAVYYFSKIRNAVFCRDMKQLLLMLLFTVTTSVFCGLRGNKTVSKFFQRSLKIQQKLSLLQSSKYTKTFVYDRLYIQIKLLRSLKISLWSARSNHLKNLVKNKEYCRIIAFVTLHTITKHFYESEKNSTSTWVT